MYKAIHKRILWLLLSFCLAACAPIQKPEQLLISDYITITPHQTFGQTFVTRYDGLNGIVFYLKPQEALRGELILSLLPLPSSPEVLRSGTLQLHPGMEAGYYRIPFAPLAASFRSYYYVRVSFQGEGALHIGVAPGETYINGAFYLNNEPLESQSAFYLTHDKVYAMLGLFQELLLWLLYIGIAVFLYILPGWGLLSPLWSGWDDLDLFEKASLAAGMSLALYPLLLLWTHLIHLHLGALYAWLPPLAALVVILWRNREKITKITIWIKSLKLTIPQTIEGWAPPGLMLVLALIVATRFWAIRTLDAPMWGDSYQHTMIAQLLIDHRGLFESWVPYVPYTTMTTHFGFHAIVAVYCWLTGAEALQGTLIVGQLLNIFAVFTLYPLARKLSAKNPFGPLGTLLIAGIFSIHPVFYVNWGRYAQLSSQVILPIALWMVLEFFFQQKHTTKISILISIVLGGMILAYYRSIFFFLAGAIVILIFLLKRLFYIKKSKTFIPLLSKSVLIPSILISLVLPWFWRVKQSTLASSLVQGLVNSPPMETMFQELKVWTTIGDYLQPSLIFLTILAFVFAGIRRRWTIICIPFAVLLLVLHRLGALWHLPGANMMQQFAILIALYLPASLMIGWLFAETFALLKSHSAFVSRLLLVTIFGMTLFQAWKIRTIANPQQYAMVTRPDIIAATWIKQKIPKDALFLVQGFRIYNGKSIVGSDAGWWLPLTAQRANTIPPQYALLNEIPNPPGYSETLVNLYATLEDHPLPDQESIQALCNLGITHVFQGQRQGKVAIPPSPLFATATLNDLPELFSPVYILDLVRIYSFNRDSCE